MGGGLRGKEKTPTRNGGVEEAGKLYESERFDNMAADNIERILFKTDNPPCFEPALLAGLSWFVERRKNNFQKTGMFFGVSGSRSIRKQIILYSQPIPQPS